MTRQPVRCDLLLFARIVVQRWLEFQLISMKLPALCVQHFAQSPMEVIIRTNLRNILVRKVQLAQDRRLAWFTMARKWKNNRDQCAPSLTVTERMHMILPSSFIKKGIVWNDVSSVWQTLVQTVLGAFYNYCLLNSCSWLSHPLSWELTQYLH